MQSIKEEKDAAPTVATKSQPLEKVNASEEAAAEESKQDDESKASDQVVPEEFKYEEPKASEEAAAEELNVSGESKLEGELDVSDETVSGESKLEGELDVSDETVSGESKLEGELDVSDETVSGESKLEGELDVSDEAVSGESKLEGEFNASEEADAEQSQYEHELKASNEAVNFLISIGKFDIHTPSSVLKAANTGWEKHQSRWFGLCVLPEPEELQRCVFSESLVVMADCGGALGEFSVSVEFTHRALEPCVILHARSHGAIDGSPCGTTVTAYLTADLEVLEEDYHEYVKLDSYNVEKRSHMVQRDKHMVINKFTAMGEDVTEEESVTYPMSVLRGLVTEGSSMLLMRLMALRKKVPKNMVFIILDQSLHINQTTFSELGVKRVQVLGETVQVFGLERMVGSADGDHSTWHCYFLDNGHLASRKQVGSPVTMKVIQELSKIYRGHMKVPLVWQEDMQLYSLYLDKKDFLKAEHNSYLREHPELRALLSDFIQDLLIVKPDNIFQFAREYFPPYATYHSPGV